MTLVSGQLDDRRQARNRVLIRISSVLPHVRAALRSNLQIILMVREKALGASTISTFLPK